MCSNVVERVETMKRALRAANVAGSNVEISSAAASSREVSASLVPELVRLGASRLEQDADFDGQRFPNADKYFRGKH